MNKNKIKDKIREIKSRIKSLDSNVKDINRIELLLELLRSKSADAFHKNLEKQDKLYCQLDELEEKLAKLS